MLKCAVKQRKVQLWERHFHDFKAAQRKELTWKQANFFAAQRNK